MTDQLNRVIDDGEYVIEDHNHGNYGRIESMVEINFWINVGYLFYIADFVMAQKTPTDKMSRSAFNLRW